MSPPESRHRGRLGLVPQSAPTPAVHHEDGPGDVRPSAADRRHNLPHLPSSFVGRCAEVADLSALLGYSRLVTVTGPGGMGKTRLALRVAARVASRFPSGVWLVELASLSDPARLPGAVSAVLPGANSGADLPTAEDIAARIADQEMLIVIDSCEHLVDACAHLVELLLKSCPALGVLTTTREPLGIAGEHVSALGPLALPAADAVDAAAVAASGAGELFVRRAAATSPGFTLTDETAPTVAELCRRLDALPLALELAAARVASLTVTEILERLDDRLVLLNAGSRTAHERHRTLAGAFEWSHDLLTPTEATLLRRLAVFAGWTIDAAEAVCAGGDVEPTDVVDLMAALVNKSLVVRDAGDARVRYRLLETVRLWAAEKLDAAPEEADVRRRHAVWCLAVAEAAEAKAGRKQAVEQLDVEHDNLSAALAWARSGEESAVGVPLAIALVPYWQAKGLVREGVAWLDWAIVAAASCPVPVQARALRGAGMLHGLLGDIGSALPLLEQSVALTVTTGSDGAACNCNPMTLMFRNPRQALPTLEERIAFCRRTADTKGLSHLFLTCGQAHFFLADAAQARLHFEELVRLGREEADGIALRSGLFGLARVAFLEGDFATAELNVTEARAMAEAEGDLDDGGTALAFLGDLARARGDWAQSRDLLETAERMARATTSPLSIARAMYLLARLAEWEGGHSPEELEALFERSLTLGQASGAPAYHEVRCLIGVGSATEARADATAARGAILESLEKAQAFDDPQATAMAFDHLSGLAAVQGKPDEAWMLACRGLELHHRIGALPGVVSSLELVAGLATAGGRHEFAGRLLGCASTAREAHGYARSHGEQLRHDADIVALRSGLGTTVFTTAWAEGVASSLDEAVVYVLRGRGSRDRPASGWESLTPAERDVVRLVREGLTNPDVGRRLFISPRTVGHHLTHVFDKVGVRSRHALIKELIAREL